MHLVGMEQIGWWIVRKCLRIGEKRLRPCEHELRPLSPPSLSKLTHGCKLAI